MSDTPSLVDLALKAELAVQSLENFTHLLGALSSAATNIDPAALVPVENSFARHLELATSAVSELRAAIGISGPKPGRARP